MVNVSLEAVQKDGESSGDICNMTLWTFPFNFHSITLRGAIQPTAEGAQVSRFA